MMLLEPNQLVDDLDRLEAIEKASLRLVVQAICDYRDTAIEIFREESDLVADIGEDITREALDRMGMARIDQRLFGKIDHKRARYLFHPDFAIRQALFVDSKAEKVSGNSNLGNFQIEQDLRSCLLRPPPNLPPDSGEFRGVCVRTIEISSENISHFPFRPELRYNQPTTQRQK